jgi:hypothetical protein
MLKAVVMRLINTSFFLPYSALPRAQLTLQLAPANPGVANTQTVPSAQMLWNDWCPREDSNLHDLAATSS